MGSDNRSTCLCGCGQPVGEGRRYAPENGHDATHLKHVYAAIRTGHLTLDQGKAELIPGTPLAEKLEEYVLAWQAKTGHAE